MGVGSLAIFVLRVGISRPRQNVTHLTAVHDAVHKITNVKSSHLTTATDLREMREEQGPVIELGKEYDESRMWGVSSYLAPVSPEAGSSVLCHLLRYPVVGLRL